MEEQVDPHWWEPIRRYRRTEWRVRAAFYVTLAVWTFEEPSLHVGLSTDVLVLMGIVTLYVIGTLMAFRALRDWRCPRCGHRFMGSFFRFRYDKCASCGARVPSENR